MKSKKQERKTTRPSLATKAKKDKAAPAPSHDESAPPAFRVALNDITERKPAKGVLNETEDRNRIIAEMISDYAYIFLVTPEGELQVGWVAESFIKTFGYIFEELKAMSWQSLVYPEDLPAAQAHARKVAGGEPDICEMRWVTAGGEIRWLRDYAKPIFDEAGKCVVRIYGAAQDITERKRMEETLRESEERFSKAFYQSPIGIALVNLTDNTVRDVNNALLEMIGFRREEIIGQNILQLSIPVDSDVHVANVWTRNELLERKAFQNISLRYEKRNGEMRDLLYSGTLITIGGRPHGLILVEDITERKRAEDEIQKVKEFNQTLLDNMSEGIVVQNTDGYFIYANPAVTKITGYSSGELIGAHWTKFFPEDQHYIIREADNLRTAGRASQYELEFIHKNGGRINLLVSGSPLFENGRYNGSLAVFTDITERKRAEIAIAQSEGRYRDLVENIHELICTHDLEGNLLSVNRAAADMLGYAPEEIVGRNLRDFLAPDVRHLFGAYLSLVQTRGAASGFMNIQTKSGEIRIWEYHNTLRTEGVDQPIVRGYAHDITEKRRAEQALRESEQRFRSLVENSSGEISILNVKGELLYESPSNHPTLGYQPGEYIGRNLFQLIHPDDVERVQEQFARLVQNPELRPREEFRLLHRDGRWIWVEAVGSNMLSNPSVGGIVVNYHNITERKQAEEKLQIQFEELQRWYKATVGREERVLQLKREVNELLRKLNEPIRYPSAE